MPLPCGKFALVIKRPNGIICMPPSIKWCICVFASHRLYKAHEVGSFEVPIARTRWTRPRNTSSSSSLCSRHSKRSRKAVKGFAPICPFNAARSGRNPLSSDGTNGKRFFASTSMSMIATRSTSKASPRSRPAKTSRDNDSQAFHKCAKQET